MPWSIANYVPRAAHGPVSASGGEPSLRSIFDFLGFRLAHAGDCPAADDAAEHGEHRYAVVIQLKAPTACESDCTRENNHV